MKNTTNAFAAKPAALSNKPNINPINIGSAGGDIEASKIEAGADLSFLSKQLVRATTSGIERNELRKLTKAYWQFKYETCVYNATLDFDEAKKVRFNKYMSSNRQLQQELLEGSMNQTLDLADMNNTVAVRSYQQAQSHIENLKELKVQNVMTDDEFEYEKEQVLTMRRILIDDIREKVRIIGEEHFKIVERTVQYFNEDYANGMA